MGVVGLVTGFVCRVLCSVVLSGPIIVVPSVLRWVEWAVETGRISIIITSVPQGASPVSPTCLLIFPAAHGVSSVPVD